MDKNLLISFKEYSAIKHKQPYFYTVESSDQVLYYFGAEHKKDPNHPQFERLQNDWNEFLQKTSGTKSIVVFECNVNITNEIMLKEAIEKYGESGAIVFWAEQAHIASVRPEPTIKDEAKVLLEDFSRDEIFYFYIIRGIVSWQRATVRKEFDEFIKLNIKRYEDVLGWSDFDFSFETVKKVHQQIFGREFNLDDKDFLIKIPNPTCDESRINEVARKSSMIRNIAILDCIENYWQEGYNIFVVYGASHAVMQEPVIKSLVP
ncbi:MAG: hypothetical protein A2747_01745 [Candidatus Yonathbacteria bacterium RIFCSPHIGHO2_01_FULL_44_41]|uniref:Uncharacterized protein n=1 Tax=Candidatus Yonathbacteria bacterium RIFCSPHIGHO2_02_FULL_44_14 TaxID=1802724 RepID=A0A1G2S912_9BACT|nr:MAG: hypothetical protein A2747_01745 [Candidatus Yonathbacteria bacterium RIFCSPHIGHO2_01_FULL_44_41]OHA81585.1 MAG: hypothetical protein A3D51_02320 [Candidatus Yonathbacteria bacterium RIFCSPHIGHO2_02_FULL_44_14]OHA81766.1 MAG: hypothetical protein A3B06_02255 [Candidatus Yonathbacteria bacterium RIFCSPLOWO2_01_FULL_43_20]